MAFFRESKNLEKNTCREMDKLAIVTHNNNNVVVAIIKSLISFEPYTVDGSISEPFKLWNFSSIIITL